MSRRDSIRSGVLCGLLSYDCSQQAIFLCCAPSRPSQTTRRVAVDNKARRRNDPQLFVLQGNEIFIVRGHLPGTESGRAKAHLRTLWRYVFSGWTETGLVPAGIHQHFECGFQSLQNLQRKCLMSREEKRVRHGVSCQRSWC